MSNKRSYNQAFYTNPKGYMVFDDSLSTADTRYLNMPRPAKRVRVRRGVDKIGIVRMPNLRSGGFVGIEKKFYDTFLAATAIASSTDCSGGEYDPATVQCLNGPQQGSGESQRDGKQIHVSNVSVKGIVTVAVQANVTSTDVAPTIMIALVQDMQTNSAQLRSEDVFENPSGQAYLTPMSFRNLEFVTRFKVLKTVTIDMEQMEPVYDGTNIEVSGRTTKFEIHHYFGRDGMDTQFKDGNEGCTSIVNNSLHIIAFTSSTTLAPQISYNSRIRYRG